MLIQEKVNQAKGILKEFDIDCWITFARESQINGDPTLAFIIKDDITWHSAFIISKSGETCAIVGGYDKKSIEDTGAFNKVISYVKSIKEDLQNYLKSLNPRQIAINYSEGSEICDGLTHGMFLILQNYLKEINMVDRIISAEPIISALRERKSSIEIQNIKQAIHITEEIFEETTEYISAGKTENEIAEFMQQAVINRGLELAWDPKFCPSVFTGPDTAEAHFTPTDKEIEKGHIVNIDFGVKFNGYCSDMQRIFYILQEGEKNAPKEVQYGFDTIVKAIDLAGKSIFAGAIGMDVDAVAREVVITAGYDEFPHALGHQVGRFSHDGTALLGPGWEKYAQKPYRKLEKNMVFTIEPRLIVPDRGIITMEEIVVIGEDGAVFLSTPQKSLILI